MDKELLLLENSGVSKNKFVLMLVSILFVVAIIINVFSERANKKLKSTYISVEDCNVQEKKCKVNLDKFRIDISADENIFYLKNFDIDVFSKEIINIESIKIYFKMKSMNMGNNHFIFNKVISDNNSQHWQANSLLPICVTGRADWFSELEIVTKSIHYIITFPLLVKKQTVN